MTVEEASELLRVSLPTNLNALKTAWRRRSREEHPDISKHQKAQARFQALSDAYDLLKNSPSILEFTEEDSRSLRTDDGTSLSELGLGLGPTTNGRPCDSCQGNGYSSHSIGQWKDCEDCRPWQLGLFYSLFEYRCRKCKGTGHFARNGKVIGDCFPCKGKGWYRSRNSTNSCLTCKGNRILPDPSRGKSIYVKCRTCEGTGEIKIYNPVLPKGLLIGK